MIPGKTTRWLSSRATVVCAAFGQTRSHLPRGTRIRVTGTPVRSAFLRLRSVQSTTANEHRPPRLIVLGGSGGARALNENVPPAIYKAQAVLAGWEVVHQTGNTDAHKTAVLYGKLGITARVAPFLDDLPQLLATSALAVSRSGGTTLAEFALCALPSILLPYPQAADDHQRGNAERFVSAQAVRMIDARDVEGRLDNALARQLTQLAGDADLRRRMGHNAGRLSHPDAAERIADLIAEIVISRQAAAA